MKRILIYISLLLLLIISISPDSIYAEVDTCGEDAGKLLSIPGYKGGEYQWGDFKYLGAFRVPKTDMGGPPSQGLSYGGDVIEFNPPNKNSQTSSKWGSLFIVGHIQSQQTAEIGIPDIVECIDPEIGAVGLIECKNPGGYPIDKLTTATALQNLADITNGNRNKITADENKEISNGGSMGGLMAWKYQQNDNDIRLISSVYAFYDGASEAVKSHFATSTKLSSSSPQFTGILPLGTKPTVPQAGFIGGYMTPIPTIKWRQCLGGKALSGMSGLPVISRSSFGPAAFSFDPDEVIDKKSPENMKVNALLYYDSAHQNIGSFSESTWKPGDLFNQGTTHSGVIFPAGSKSVIFTGRFGQGQPCYGEGTGNKEEDGNTSDQLPPNNTCGGAVMTASGVKCCYDPTDSSKGTHAYPYATYAWAYDANDLARVKAGGRIVDDPSDNLVDGITKTSTEIYKPWHIKPYAYGEIKSPFTDKNSSGRQGAAAYDEENKRLYLVQPRADNMLPIIHVFQIEIDSVPKIKMINIVQ